MFRGYRALSVLCMHVSYGTDSTWEFKQIKNKQKQLKFEVTLSASNKVFYSRPLNAATPLNAPPPPPHNVADFKVPEYVSSWLRIYYI